jgi:hypothetical protein
MSLVDADKIIAGPLIYELVTLRPMDSPSATRHAANAPRVFALARR